jgi:YbbR domain-containing protein
VSWITDDFRLKLLAVGLAVLMLGAVAFSQNPPTTKTLTRTIDYVVPEGKAVLNPPSRATLTVTGLADTISTVTPNSVAVTIDLSNVAPGSSVKVTPVAKSLVPGVTISNPPAPIALFIDQMLKVHLPVTVRTPRQTPGWLVTKAQALCPTPPSTPCSVMFIGPASIETNLSAYADFTAPVLAATYDTPNVQVTLEQNGKPIDQAKLANTVIPQPSLDPNFVSIHIEAKATTASGQVVLVDSPPSSPPPTCYRITGISIDPAIVIVSGPPQTVNNMTTITLPAIDLSHDTSSTTVKVTIPYPDGVSSGNTTALVTYSISKNPNCASPSP